MPSVTSSVNELRSSVISISLGLFQSLVVLFRAILTFGRDILSAVLNLGQALFKAAVGTAGGVAELIWGASSVLNRRLVAIKSDSSIRPANLFAIALCAGGYYLYTRLMQNSPRRGKRRS